MISISRIPGNAFKQAAGIGIAASIFIFTLDRQIAFAACAGNDNEDVVIALDVGHTPTQPGATSARGVTEYAFNRELAGRIKDKLIGSRFRSTSVILTQMDGTAGLRQRVRRAADMNADIFFSIHHDGVHDEYTIPWLYQGRQEYYFDGAKGFSLHVSSKNIRYDDSLRLAQILADELIDSGLTFTTIHETRHPEGARVPFVDSTRGIYRRDNLVVLREAEMPAVLIEGGMIVNRDEELALASPLRQTTIASAVVAAVTKFCSAEEESVAYRVTRVAADDVLNIRSGPSADYSVVGTIPPGGRGIQIVGACAGRWCQINYRGARGWVNRQFLARE